MIRGVLFDLDGTLLDTAPDLVASLNHVRNLEGLDPIEETTLAPHASRGAKGLIAAGFSNDDEASRPRRVEQFLSHYADNHWVRSRMFEGVEELLAALDAGGIPWGIVTNKAEYLTLPIIEAVGWGRRARCVIGGDTTARSKPDPLPVSTACELLQLEAASVLFVGDDERDLQAGLAAGTPVAVADWGYGAGDIQPEWRRRASEFASASHLLAAMRDGAVPTALTSP